MLKDFVRLRCFKAPYMISPYGWGRSQYICLQPILSPILQVEGVHSLLLCRDPKNPDLNQGELDTTYLLTVIEKLTSRTDIIKHVRHSE